MNNYLLEYFKFTSMKRKLTFILYIFISSIFLSGCWLDSTTPDDDKIKAAKSYIKSSDILMCTERGGYCIVRDKNTKKYYQISHTGDRTEVVRKYY